MGQMGQSAGNCPNLTLDSQYRGKMICRRCGQVKNIAQLQTHYFSTLARGGMRLSRHRLGLGHKGQCSAICLKPTRGQGQMTQADMRLRATPTKRAARITRNCRDKRNTSARITATIAKSSHTKPLTGGAQCPTLGPHPQGTPPTAGQLHHPHATRSACSVTPAPVAASDTPDRLDQGEQQRGRT